MTENEVFVPPTHKKPQNYYNVSQLNTSLVH